MPRSPEALRPDSDAHFHLTNNKIILVLVKMIIMKKKIQSTCLLQLKRRDFLGCQGSVITKQHAVRYDSGQTSPEKGTQLRAPPVPAAHNQIVTIHSARENKTTAHAANVLTCSCVAFEQKKI